MLTLGFTDKDGTTDGAILTRGFADEDGTADGAALKLGIWEGEMDGPGLLNGANEGAWLRLGAKDGDRDTDVFSDSEGAVFGEILGALDRLGFDDPQGAKDGDIEIGGFSHSETGALVGFGVVGEEVDGAGDGKGVGAGLGALVGKLVGSGVVGGEVDGLDGGLVVAPGAVGGWEVGASLASTTPAGAAVTPSASRAHTDVSSMLSYGTPSCILGTKGSFEIDP
jgi:hypothetical protein